MMCKLKGWMDKGGHYDEEIKRVDAKRRALLCANSKGGWIREGIIMWK